MPMKTCLVGLDGSEPSVRALERALGEAENGATILAVYVVEALTFFDAATPDTETTFHRIHQEAGKILAQAEALAAQYGVSIRTRAEAGRPAETLARIARQEALDEIIVGSRGKDEVQNLLLGSVSARLVQIAPCTVVVVR